MSSELKISLALRLCVLLLKSRSSLFFVRGEMWVLMMRRLLAYILLHREKNQRAIIIAYTNEMLLLRAGRIIDAAAPVQTRKNAKNIDDIHHKLHDAVLFALK